MAYDLFHNGKNYTLVDTPGFDDSSKSDAVVVEELLQWLETSFRQGKRLNGIIYVHSILEPRMKGSALRNMAMFRKLCGPDCYKNIVLATSFWDKLESKSVGVDRERELKENPKFWGSMVKKDSRVVRLAQEESEEETSIFEVIDLIGSKEKIVLQAQAELVQQNKSHAQTAAAVIVNEQAEKLEAQKIERLEQVKAAAKKKVAEQEAERERKARVERDLLAARLRQKERQNRERREKQEREARELRESQQRAKEEAAKKERERVAREAERIKAADAARLKRQREAEQRAAQTRANYYRTFRCAGITPRGNCDKCGSRLSRWKYYFRTCEELFIEPPQIFQWSQIKELTCPSRLLSLFFSR